MEYNEKTETMIPRFTAANMWNRLFINFYAVSTDDDIKKAALIFVNEKKKRNRTV